MDRLFLEKLKIPEAVRIPYFGGKWYQFLNKQDNKSILREEIPKNPLNDKKREETVIVSLTSFPDRIKSVHLAIKSLMLQTYKPDRILLWLAEEQFPQKQLPKDLLELKDHGLEICWVNDDLYGHKKYYFSMLNQQKDELLITYDDDLIYPPDSIERLIKTHKKYPYSIVCNRAQVLSYDKLGKINNPGRWETISNKGLDKPSYQLAPSTGGGCLYPYGVIAFDLINADKIKQTALKGDDLWIMFVAAESKTKIIKTCKYHRIFSVIDGTQVKQLSAINILNDKYMETLNDLIAAFPLAWQRIRTDKD